MILPREAFLSMCGHAKTPQGNTDQHAVRQRVLPVTPDSFSRNLRAAKFVDAIDLRFCGSDGRDNRGEQALPRLGLMTARAERARGKPAHVVGAPHGFASRRADMSPMRRLISSGVIKPFSTTSVEMPIAHLSK